MIQVINYLLRWRNKSAISSWPSRLRQNVYAPVRLSRGLWEIPAGICLNSRPIMLNAAHLRGIRPNIHGHVLKLQGLKRTPPLPKAKIMWFCDGRFLAALARGTLASPTCSAGRANRSYDPVATPFFHLKVCKALKFPLRHLHFYSRW